MLGDLCVKKGVMVLWDGMASGSENVRSCADDCSMEADRPVSLMSPWPVLLLLWPLRRCVYLLMCLVRGRRGDVKSVPNARHPRSVLAVTEPRSHHRAAGRKTAEGDFVLGYIRLHRLTFATPSRLSPHPHPSVLCCLRALSTPHSHHPSLDPSASRRRRMRFQARVVGRLATSQERLRHALHRVPRDPSLLLSRVASIL